MSRAIRVYGVVFVVSGSVFYCLLGFRVQVVESPNYPLSCPTYPQLGAHEASDASDVFGNAKDANPRAGPNTPPPPETPFQL